MKLLKEIKFSFKNATYNKANKPSKDSLEIALIDSLIILALFGLISLILALFLKLWGNLPFVQNCLNLGLIGVSLATLQYISSKLLLWQWVDYQSVMIDSEDGKSKITANNKVTLEHNHVGSESRHVIYSQLPLSPELLQKLAHSVILDNMAINRPNCQSLGISQNLFPQLRDNLLQNGYISKSGNSLTLTDLGIDTFTQITKQSPTLLKDSYDS